MRALPLDIGLIHFVGIGGIGMSGIAERRRHGRSDCASGADAPQYVATRNHTGRFVSHRHSPSFTCSSAANSIVRSLMLSSSSSVHDAIKCLLPY